MARGEAWSQLAPNHIILSLPVKIYLALTLPSVKNNAGGEEIRGTQSWRDRESLLCLWVMIGMIVQFLDNK